MVSKQAINEVNQILALNMKREQQSQMELVQENSEALELY